MQKIFITTVQAFCLTLTALLLHAFPALADYDHGVELYNNGDFVAAFQELLPLAEAGNMDAQQAIGLMYERGRGVKTNYAEAARWYERAAIQGHEIAAGNLGVLYRDGSGVARNYQMAIKWLIQGAMADEPYAQYNLGALYANGQGTKADPVEGWAWISLAVDQAVPGASADLDRIGQRLSSAELARAENRADELIERINGGKTDSGYGNHSGLPDTGEMIDPLSPTEEKETRDAMKSAWRTWKDAAFMLRHPADWSVGKMDQGIIMVSGSRGENLIIWPLFSRQKISEVGAARLLESINRKIKPDSELSRARTIGSGVVKADGISKDREYASSLVWESTSAGDKATYVLASAPRGTLTIAAPILAKIMKSATLSGIGTLPKSDSAASPGNIAYTSFTDPSEGAFTVEVPVGWQVKGGLVRFNASDVRPWLRLTSPDRLSLVFMGDAEIPTMLVPNDGLREMGFTEGMTYDSGYNQRFLLKPYYPGKEAARLYVESKMSSQCKNGIVKEFRGRPETSAEINRIFRRYKSPFASQELHTGDISRSCPDTGRAQYVFAGTLLSQFPTYQETFSMWLLNYLYGFDAPAKDAATSLAITRHLAESFRITEQWANMNGGLQSQVSTIVAQTGAAIAKIQSKAFWNARRTGEKSLEKYGQAVRGVEETLDPLTGEKIEVVAGFNHNWIDHAGNVVGTQIDASPGIDYRKLVQVTD